MKIGLNFPPLFYKLHKLFHLRNSRMVTMRQKENLSQRL